MLFSSSQVSTWFGQGSGNLSIPSRAAPPISIDFLVIAGGSGGFRGVVNQFDGCGGDAGGYRTSTGGNGYRGAAAESSTLVVGGGSYTVTVGAGGASSSAGSNSVFSAITSTGGPATGGNNAGKYGGEGSGSGPISTFVGGAGTANTITGSSVTRAGGGGSAHTGSYAGSAGGGTGNSGGTGGAATANTGSGGGGGRQAEGGSGGSGLVVLQYPSAYTITIGAGLTGTTATVGANKVTTFTAGTGTVSWA